MVSIMMQLSSKDMNNVDAMKTMILILMFVSILIDN